MKANQYLDDVKTRHNLSTDYALAKTLAVSHGTISNYRKGRSVMDPTLAVKVAELLNLNPLVVIAAAELERARRDDVKKVWLRYAAALMLAVAAGAPQDGNARTLHNINLPVTGSEYTFQHNRRKRRSATTPGRTRRARRPQSGVVNAGVANRKKTA
jgi:transcriptional regulator with XRE-family HTH domain